MPKNHLAPSSKSTTSVAEFRKVATPWVAFVAEQPNDIAGQNADPDGTMEDSVDISDPHYDESKTRTIEVEYAAADHLEPPIHVNTLDSSNSSAKPAPSETNPSKANNSETDPSEAATALDSSEIYEPSDHPSSSAS